MEHLEARVRRQPVHFPERAQRLEDEARGYERTAGDAEHGCVDDAETLGCDSGAEVDLVANDDVRRPFATERDDRLGPLARDATRERRPDGARLAILVDGEQRQTLLGGEQAGSAGGERRETRRLDRLGHPLLTRERNDVTCPLGSAGDRSERQEVAGAAGEGEQDPHRVILGRHACSGLSRCGASRGRPRQGTASRGAARRCHRRNENIGNGMSRTGSELRSRGDRVTMGRRPGNEGVR